jgi:hypothetical protein
MGDDVIEPPEVNLDSDVPVELDGGTTPTEDARILTEYGVPSRAESGLTLPELAALVEHGAA